MRKLSFRITSTIALAIIGGAGLPGVVAAKGGARSGTVHPVVRTREGPVRGFIKGGVQQFLGIPFAAPPVGPRRWQPPAPPAMHSLLDATKFSAACPQVTTLGLFAGPTSITEDCLYLNVFTTGKGTGGIKKPVIVWIHGGGNVDGSSDVYDGGKLATGGPNGVPTVVVTINYRLGLLGYLSERHLNQEGHQWGNYGTLDQQAALRWVRDNIAAFGGDPGNVTLAGESSGAENVFVNVVSPQAKGLFHKAILQSYPVPAGYMGNSAEDAAASGKAFAEAAGCSDAACLRSLPVARILQLQGTIASFGKYKGDVFVDGTILPRPVGVAVSTGAYTHMPLLGGVTTNEETFLMGVKQYFDPASAAMTPEQYVAANGKSILQKYPLDKYENNPTYAQSSVLTDQFVCRTWEGLRVFSKTNTGYPAYGYEFSYQDTPYYLPEMPNPYDSTGRYRALAFHTAEIGYLFRGFHGGQLGVNLDQRTGKPRDLEGAEIALSDRMVASWTKFARSGNPNGTGDAPWPAVKPDRNVWMRLDIKEATIEPEEFAQKHNCAFWDSMGQK